MRLFCIQRHQNQLHDFVNLPLLVLTPLKLTSGGEDMEKRAEPDFGVPGSHHCGKVGKRIAEVIFDALEQEAKARSGSLSSSEIKEFARAFLKADQLFIPIYEQCFAACSSSLKVAKEQSNNAPRSSRLTIPENPDEADAIFLKLIHTFLSDLYPTVCPDQWPHADEDWAISLSTVLASYIQTRVGTGLIKKLATAYDMAHIDADQVDYWSVPQIKTQMTDISGLMRRNNTNSEAAQALTLLVNGEIKKRPASDERRLLFVKVREMDDLFDGFYRLMRAAR